MTFPRILHSISLLALAGSAIAALPGNAETLNIPLDARGHMAHTLQPADLQLQIDGKLTPVLSVSSTEAPAELVVLIDNTSTGTVTLQYDALRSFFQQLPPTTRVAVATTQFGTARLLAPLSTDHLAAGKALAIPAGPAGTNASPYFCLSDLARHWPSQDAAARRFVLLISNGVDNYHPHFDAQDPYLDAAIHDAARAHLVVSSIYWPGDSRFARHFAYSGQNMLTMLAEATGGHNYWLGFSAPVDLTPYLTDLSTSIKGQMVMTIERPTTLKGKNPVVPVAVRNSRRDIEIDYPHSVAAGA